MNILLACEGDAETHDAWSGVCRSIVVNLRAAGHNVRAVDTDVYGLAAGVLAIRTASSSRRRWSVRYHLGAEGFRARSARCAARMRRVGTDVDVILQIGATFELPEEVRAPIVLFCDSNIEMSRAAAVSGYSEASVLKSNEIKRIRKRESKVYDRASVILCMSDWLRKSFVEDFGVLATKLVTVHCGPNEVPAHAPEKRKADVRAPTILFVGRDAERKGADLLIRAFDLVREEIPHATLKMVGLIGSGRANVGVQFTGYLDRDTPAGRNAMDLAYRDSTVFCLPTRFDPFGTSFVEAMAYGLPCVGPNAWAVPEIIEDGRTGLIVPPEDPAAIASALIRLLRDPDLATRMGDAGRARAISSFSWPELTKRMVAAMERAVDERGQLESPPARS